MLKKKIVLLFSYLFILVCAVHAVTGKALVTGKINGFKGGVVSFSYQEYALLSNQEKQEIEVAADGVFRFEVALSGPARVFLILGSTPTEENFSLVKGDGRDTTVSTTTNRPELIYLYLSPRDRQHIEVTIGDIPTTLQISGKHSADSRYLNEEDWLFNQYRDKHLKNYFGYVYYNPGQYNSYVEQRRAARAELLAQFTKKHKLSKHLIHVSEWTIYADAIMARLQYPTMRATYRSDNYIAEHGYYDFLLDVKTDNSKMEKGIAYFYFLDFYLKESYRISGSKADYFDFVAAQISDRPLYEYYAFALRANFKRKLYEKFGSSAPYPDIAKKVKEKYHAMEGMLEGNKAPLVVLQDTTGKNFTFENWKGKYIYIDFWATWCGPCIQEIPHLKKLEHDYGDKNIVFVSISMDRENDRQKWVDFIDKEKLGGIQVWLDAANNKQISKALNILQIPRFVLLDDQGRIVDPNAARPSDSRIRIQLDMLL